MRAETAVEKSLTDALIEQVVENTNLSRHTKRRLDLIIWIAIAMLVLAALGVAIRLVNFYSLKADVDVSNESNRTLTETNKDLTLRVNKLRSEIAIRDARFQASKSVVNGTGKLNDLLAIQGVLDAYASEMLRNGNGHDKTTDDVRREACERLRVAGYPCMP
jgi:cell division protein FtsB